jgi:hypothetical protein
MNLIKIFVASKSIQGKTMMLKNNSTWHEKSDLVNQQRESSEWLAFLAEKETDYLRVGYETPETGAYQVPEKSQPEKVD